MLELVVDDMNDGTHTIWLVDPESEARTYQGDVRMVKGSYQVFAADDPGQSLDGRTYGWLVEAIAGFQAWSRLDARIITRPIEIPEDILAVKPRPQNSVSTDW